MSSSYKSYFIAIIWFILSLIIGVANDSIVKHLSGNINFYQIAFFRFTFSALLLVPFLLYNGVTHMKTSNIWIHILRGTLLFLGMVSWVKGLSFVHLTTTTVIGFSIPLFILILAVIILKEKVIWQRWLVTILGLIGVFVALKVYKEDFNPQTLILVFAALMFALLDIVNKKFVSQESMLNMLFYSAIVTAMLALPMTFIAWQNLTIDEIFLLVLLGAGANLLLYCLLKAFNLVDASAIAPYRYVELPISAFIGYVFFNEIVGTSTYIGAFIIIPATLFIIYSESYKKNHN